MKLLVELTEEGSVTAETVRKNVEEAIEYWRATEGLSGQDDDGFIHPGVKVTVIDGYQYV